MEEAKIKMLKDFMPGDIVHRLKPIDEWIRFEQNIVYDNDMCQQFVFHGFVVSRECMPKMFENVK